MLLDHFNDEFPLLTNALRQAKIADRLSHAYIIHSDQPDIRKNFVKALAELTLCPTPTPEGNPCGQCVTCDLVSKDKYPEIFTLSPTSKSRAIKVGDDERDPDSVRWFEHQFYLTSLTVSGIKIGVIEDAECMQPVAQNAFLKTLEEPPGKTFFFLATGNPASLLNTIRSRCQTLLLLKNICDYQFEGAPELFNCLHTLQFAASGSLAKAESCVGRLLNISSSLQSCAEDSLKEKWTKQLALLEEFSASEKKRAEDRHKAAVQAEYLRLRSYFLSAIHTWFAQVFQLSKGLSLDYLSNPEIFQMTAPLPDKLPEKYAYKGLSHAEKLLQNLNWNVSEELAFRNFCLQIACS